MSDLANVWQRLGARIQSLDPLNSDYLMPLKDPLNRYILRYKILEAGLGTSLRPVWGLFLDLVLGLDLGPGSGPGSHVLDPSISDLRIYSILQSNGRMNRLILIFLK